MELGQHYTHQNSFLQARELCEAPSPLQSFGLATFVGEGTLECLSALHGAQGEG
jgi:hypothetical protein